MNKLKLFHIVLTDYQGSKANYLVTAETKKGALLRIILRESTYWDSIVHVTINQPYSLSAVNGDSFLRRLHP